MTRRQAEERRQADLLDVLVQQGYLLSYSFDRDPQDPEDMDELLVLTFPSGRSIRITAVSLTSGGVLRVR